MMIYENNEVGRYEYTAKLHPTECSFAVSYIFFWHSCKYPWLIFVV